MLKGSMTFQYNALVSHLGSTSMETNGMSESEFGSILFGTALRPMFNLLETISKPRAGMSLRAQQGNLPPIGLRLLRDRLVTINLKVDRL